MLGGSGEKKTFRLAARYADHLNLITPMSELRHKLDVLKQRCDEAERDPSTLETSTLLTVVLDGTTPGAMSPRRSAVAPCAAPRNR